MDCSYVVCGKVVNAVTDEVSIINDVIDLEKYSINYLELIDVIKDFCFKYINNKEYIIGILSKYKGNEDIVPINNMIKKRINNRIELLCEEFMNEYKYSIYYNVIVSMYCEIMVYIGLIIDNYDEYYKAYKIMKSEDNFKLTLLSRCKLFS